MSEYSRIRGPIGTLLDEIHHSSSWVLVFGIALVLVGVACLVAASVATLVTVIAFGSLLVIGAAISLLHAFEARAGSSFFLYLMSVMLRGVTGLLLIRYPSAGAMSLTLILASLFLVGGMFRAVGCAALKFPRWGWGAVAGTISVALGIVLLEQLPVLSTWFLGFAIGVDLICEGVGVVAAGLVLDGVSARLRVTGS